MSFYSGQKHPHYFGVLYPLYYIVVAYFLSFTFDSIFGKILTMLFVFGLIFLNFQKYPYFHNPSNNQIQLAHKIAKKIYDNIDKEKFTVTALPEKYSDSTYRYFLELWKKRSIEKDSFGIDRFIRLQGVPPVSFRELCGQDERDGQINRSPEHLFARLSGCHNGRGLIGKNHAASSFILSARYILRGSSAFSPILKAGVGETGANMASTPLKAFSKSSINLDLTF